MSKLAVICVAIVAALHFAIMFVEMFNWSGMAARLLAQEIADATAKGFDLVEATGVMAKNQGLYNGFLAAGLVWALCVAESNWKRHIATFFLLCIAVAGVYGWATTGSAVILIAQTGLALLALGAVHFAKPSA